MTLKSKLIEAENIARELFKTIEDRQIIQPGKSEKEINTEIFNLAEEVYGIKKYWHKRIVRCGINTLAPYDENPPDLILQNDEILFIDFGPILEEWEADYGRTFVLGKNPYKLKLKKDIESAWYEAKKWFDKKNKLTGAEYWNYIIGLAKKYGYEYGGEIAGHLIGHFPHEKLEPENYDLYIHPENHNNMFSNDANGNKRMWILEIHFIDKKRKIGGFFEQLLT